MDSRFAATELAVALASRNDADTVSKPVKETAA
jgi:hypothetical protein